MDESALARVEHQRTELENNIANLRKALRHWQTLEIDYEGLKEEFLGIPDDSSAEECLQAARDSKPELVNEKELQDLLSDNSSRPRQPLQLVDLLSKRADYVKRNIEVLRKQLSDAEKKRNALLLAEEPDHRDEAGLPLAEITEELDEAGHVISSKVETPGSSAPQLIDVLKKAGVQDLMETNGTVTEAVLPSNDVKGDNSESDLRENEAAALAQPENASIAIIGGKSELSAAQFPTNPSDTPAEAELRREMIEYSRGLDEVGAIVAELDLEEDASDVSYDDQDLGLDFDSEVDVDDDFDEDESEDETGKSKHPLSLSRGYQKRMKELQEKLGLQNVGPQPEVEEATEQLGQAQRPPAAEAARKAAIARHEKSTKSSLKTAPKMAPEDNEAAKTKPGKKRVAFSSELDIASEKPPATASPTSTKASLAEMQKPRSRPINDSIVERETNQDEAEPAAPAAPAPKAAEQSRFKATRHSQPQTPMFAPPMTFPPEKTEDDKSHPQPPSKIISTNLVERPSSKTTNAPDPNDFSDEAHRREIAMDYQQHRIKRIHEQEGGFIGNGEDGEITPLEDENGRKVSRFKAARIKR